jgi:raffinose/stachyose/melibiose transport system permease protein
MLQKELRKLIWIFLVPPLVVWAVLNIYPMVSSFYWALTPYDGVNPATAVFTGLENYERMMGDTRWIASIGNTFYIAFGLIVTILPLSMMFAVMIMMTKKGQGVLKTFVYLPSILPTVIVALLWVFILDPSVGLFGFALDALELRQVLRELFNLRTFHLLGNPHTARYVVVLISTWSALGFYTLIFLAGLSRIPQELYDAANIDGAQGFSLFRYITFPLLYPTIQTVLLLLIINALQTFTFIYVIMGGFPGSTTQVMATYIYRTGFVDYQFGYATAMGTIMMVIVLVITLLSRRLTKREAIQY